MAVKLLALRRACACASCAGTITVGVRAWWNSEDQSHTCVNCRPNAPGRGRSAARLVTPSASGETDSWRRTTLRSLRANGAVLVLPPEGAAAAAEFVAVAPSGVWVVGVLDDAGRLELRDVARHVKYDWRFFVGRHDRTRALTALEWVRQDLVQRIGPHELCALGAETHVAMCVPNGERRPHETPFAHEGVWVLRPEELVAHVTGPGPLSRAEVGRIALRCERALA